jgi:hypothetical protein
MITDIDTDKLRFPVGKFKMPAEYSNENISEWIKIISELPLRLRKAVDKLDDAQLDTPYREGGWTVRQVVHHLADSHLNSYCRFKLALTEDTPVIRPYLEEKWAELEDAKYAGVELSLNLLEALHNRWVCFMKKMTPSDWERTFFHPESKKEFMLKSILALYAWHSEHHLQHILRLKERMKW